MSPEPGVPVPFALAESKSAWHRSQAALPLREKVRILLELQRQDLPLIANGGRSAEGIDDAQRTQIGEAGNIFRIERVDVRLLARSEDRRVPE